ncbi:hypothetical protein EON65_22740 [archaeon]|nr:MAG: hypothetical protein EON65_22740 [archaeon]
MPYWKPNQRAGSPDPRRQSTGSDGGNGNNKSPRLSGGAAAFRRVDTDEWNKQIITGLEDNSYVKQFGDDGYGAKANKVYR